MGDEKKSVFHLAIPCRDLDEAEEFYVKKVGARLARRYDDRITLDFFGDQIVCHLAPDKIDPSPQMYPRHFGITFREKAEFDRFLNAVKARGLEFFKEPFVRFAGMKEVHVTFFLKDPSNNLLEFKHYADPAMMY
nr:VOC family protein [Nitrospirota bacterium]